MNQQLPFSNHFLEGGKQNIGNIFIEAPVSGDLVQVGHGNLALFQLKVLGVQDTTLRLNPQDPLLQMLMQMVADGNAQGNQLTADGIRPDIVPPTRKAEDFLPGAPFASPFGAPAPLSGDIAQLVKDQASFNSLLQQLDQHLDQHVHGTLASLSNMTQSINLSDVLLQKGNLALWRFRQGALRLFAEQSSLYLLAETQDIAQPMLGAFQTAAKTNLEVLRGWVLFQKYRLSTPALIDPQAFAKLSQGDWQMVLDGWKKEQRLPAEQAQAEQAYLNALGKHYDAQVVQSSAREAEWYFREALRRQPDQSAAFVNLAALLSESALVVYIELGTPDRARLQQARDMFRQARELLDQRSDEDGKLALAQCLLYEATSLPPDARLETIQWATNLTQQLRVALGTNTPGGVRLDIIQRNLARRDAGFVDWEKIKYAQAILISLGIGGGIGASLVLLVEQWLGAHSQTPASLQGEKMRTRHHPRPNHTIEPGGASHRFHPSSFHSPDSPSKQLPERFGVSPTMFAGKSIVQKTLRTTVGKVIATAVVSMIVIASISGAILTHRPLVSHAHSISTVNATATSTPGNVPDTVTPIPHNLITEFSLPSAGYGITTGPDGNLWIMGADNQVERVTPAGQTTEIPMPANDNGNGNLKTFANGVTVGTDGNLWFIESYGKIGRMSVSGQLTEFSVFAPYDVSLTTITKGANNTLWFGDLDGQIGSITLNGTINQYNASTIGQINSLAPGPDGNIWFTSSNIEASAQIGFITPSGTVTTYNVPSYNPEPLGITAGPDGNLWFTEMNSDKIGRITPTGMVTEFPLPTSNSEPGDIAVGPDGNLWFTEDNTNQIGRITPTGVVTEFSTPSGSQPDQITVGPGGQLWFSESGTDQLGCIAVG